MYYCVFSHLVVLTLSDPVDCSPPGSSVHGIFRQEHWSGLLFPPPGIFLTQASFLCLRIGRQILYCLNYHH